MTDITVDMDGVPGLIADLEAAGKDITPGLRVGAEYLKERMTVYPPEGQSHRPQPFTSDRQRRGFFAKLKAGEIEVPYRRGVSPGSQQLGRSWEVNTAANDVLIGTRVGYAPLVQARADQTRYHKGTGWRTAEDVVEKYGSRAAELVKDTLIRSLG